MTLFHRTTDRVRVSAICVDFCRSYALSYMLWHIELKFCIWLCFTVLRIKFESRQFASILVRVKPLLELRILKIHSFPHLHALTYWAEILHMTLFYCTTDQVRMSSIFVGVMPLLELRILKIHSFPHFSLTCLDILSWNFAFDFVLLYFRSRSSVVNFRHFLYELCPFYNLEYWKYSVFRTFLLHALTYWAAILHITLLNCTTDQVWVWSIRIN